MSRTPAEFVRQIGLGLAVAFALSASVAASAGPAPKTIPAQAYPPNEVGLIPIIEYHAIGGEAEFKGGPRYDARGLNILPGIFRSQLRRMYAAGWYPINMRDVLSPRFNVPRGRIPVVLTFDDARPSQFRYLRNGKLDPDCAVAILEAFHRLHPDWPRRASFYVLPENGRDDKFYDNGVPFDQDGRETRKLQFLARSGYEIGNHSTTHRSLYCLSAPTLRWEMAECVRYVRARVPNAQIDTIALPYGIAPSDPYQWDVLLSGAANGVAYRNRCILWADGGPAYAPLHRKFDPRRVTRILPTPGNVERWIDSLKPGREAEPYVSDGDPDTVTVPAAQLPNLDRSRLRDRRLRLRVAAVRRLKQKFTNGSPGRRESNMGRRELASGKTDAR